MEWFNLLSSSRANGQKIPTGEISRSAFEQDYDRIIFSHPFRRLQDKTQVHPLPEHDFVHTRLTHSLEVSSVGRSIGRKSGEIILQRHAELRGAFSLFDTGAIVAAASLAHDLGNPPFGHAGEDAISDFFLKHPSGQFFKGLVTEAQWAELVCFEGNAQGFRILNNDQYGLKLTHATLGAFTKYPCPAFLPSRDRSRKSQKKFGFFETEKQLFSSLASNLGLEQNSGSTWLRHPLAFLVEAADDICYGIIDLEDGCRLGLVAFDEVVDLLAPILSSKLNREKLKKNSGLNEKLGVLRALAIGELIEAVTDIFLANERDILSGTMDEALVAKSNFNGALNSISEVSVQKIYRSAQVVEIEAAGHEVLPGLLDEFTRAGLHLIGDQHSRKYDNMVLLLPDEIKAGILGSHKDHYRMLRLIIDFVSGMTDRHALSLFRKIKGISL